MQIIDNPIKSTWSQLLKRPTQTVETIEKTVNKVFEDVSKNGDLAIAKYTKQFDGCQLPSHTAVSYTHLTLPTNREV